MRKTPAAQAGVALIEFAIAIPFLMILLIGIIETGRFAYYNILVGSAAHAGALYGSQNLVTAADAAHMTDAALKNGQNVPEITVSPAPSAYCQCYNGTAGTATALSCSLNGSTCPSGSHRIMYVQVSVTGRVNTLFDYAPLGLPNPWIITRTAVMRVANAAQ